MPTTNICPTLPPRHQRHFLPTPTSTCQCQNLPPTPCPRKATLLPLLCNTQCFRRSKGSTPTSCQRTIWDNTRCSSLPKRGRWPICSLFALRFFWDDHGFFATRAVVVRTFRGTFNVTVTCAGLNARHVATHENAFTTVRVVLRWVTRDGFLLQAVFVIARLDRDFRGDLQLHLLRTCVVVNDYLALEGGHLPYFQGTLYRRTTGTFSHAIEVDRCGCPTFFVHDLGLTRDV